ncbi:outer membrane beta-barrel family protein [Mucilaginibacter sp.]|uniref:outer membrane beta-barrel family protein n=1 Tax=Mucilaginibacter sp. TaxID=1882438 RepID=UPI002610210A|nr:outer membrane beta-barrel family protein [Mucilaginibacter sp.]MDB4920726.1 TonB-dependent receptor [Mucilaginibacter sp.]
MKYIFTFFIITIAISNLSAQFKLTGTVNTLAKRPADFASVNLKNLTDNNDKTVLADSTGHFSFNDLAAGKYLVSTSVMGYFPAQLNVILTRDTTLNIILAITNTQLSEVTITSSKPVIENNTEKLVYNVSSSITANGGDALAAISKVPGIRVNNKEISIAGKGMVRVMVNDRLVQLAGEDLTRYLKSMSANQISKIELIKNPSAEYDAEGNAGLINITTKQSKKQGLSGNVQLSGKKWLQSPANVFGTGNWWMLNSSANLNYNSKKLSAYASLNVNGDHELEGFETDVFYPKQTWKQTDTGNYRLHEYSYVLGLDYKLSPKATIGFNYLGGTTTYDGSDHVNNPVYNQSGQLDSTLRTFATYHPIAISNSINLHSIIKFDTTGKRLSLNADYFNYYRTDRSDFETNTWLPNGTVVPAANARYHDNNKQNINVYTFKADAEIPTPFAKLAFGGKLSFIDTYSNAFYYNRTGINTLTYNTNLSNEFDYKENTQSVYFNLDGEKKKWKYQAGLRGELTQTTGYSYTLNTSNVNKYFRLFPSMLLSYQADSANSFALTFGRRINRPVFWNLNPFKSLFTAYSYGEGNPFLQPEYNTNLELSHTYKNILTSAVFLNVTDNGFYNVTVASVDTNLVYTIPLNFIKTYRIGISESLSLHPFEWLENNEQVTAYHTSAHSDLSYISSIKGYGLYLATNNTIYFNKDKTLASAIDFWYQFPEVDHIGRADAYYKLDVGFSALALQKKLNISLNLNDAFRSSANAVTTNVNGIREKFTNFQLNRFVQLAVSYRFGIETNGSKADTGNADERSRAH